MTYYPYEEFPRNFSFPFSSIDLIEFDDDGDAFSMLHAFHPPRALFSQPSAKLFLAV